jgi:hypothetical protein
MKNTNDTTLARNASVDDRILSWHANITQHGKRNHPAFSRLIRIIKTWCDNGYNGADEEWRNIHLNHSYTLPSSASLKEGLCWIYAIIHKTLHDGIYIGRTTQSLYNRFWQHYKSHPKQHDKAYNLHNSMIKDGVSNFIIVGIEQVKCTIKEKTRHKIVLKPTLPSKKDTSPPTNEQLREQVWQSKLDTIHHGYNNIRALAMKRLNKRRALVVHSKKDIMAVTHKHMIKQWHQHEHKLPNQFFDSYTNEALMTLAVKMIAQHRSSSEQQLGKTILKSIRVREGDTAVETLEPKQKTYSSVLPFASEQMDDVPIQQILNDPAVRNLIPYGSSLRDSLFKIRFRYNMSLRRVACTYSTLHISIILM